MLEVVDTVAVQASAEQDLQLAALDPAQAQVLDVAYNARRQKAEYVSQLRSDAVYLPELPDSTAQDVYDRIVEAERSLAAPHLLAAEYAEGTATYADELTIFGISTRLLTEAQHGTSTVRKKTGEMGDPDHGTSGLGYVVAMDGLSKVIVPRGRQTSNANVDPDHPIKHAIAAQLEALPYKDFLSIHGMPPGKTDSLREHSEIHAIIGLGLNPRSVSVALAEQLKAAARERYGLRVVIGNEVPHFNMAKKPGADDRTFWDRSNEPERDEHGLIKVQRVAAMMKNSTTSYVTQLTSERPEVSSMQLEISRSLRLMPEDRWRRDKKEEVMGVYFGYSLVKLAAELAAVREM